MYLDNWFLGVQRGLGQLRRGGGELHRLARRATMYTQRDINRFNGDLLDGRLDRILPGFSSINYAQAIDESRATTASPWGPASTARTSRSALAYTLGKAIDRSSTATPTQRPDAYGPDDQDEGPSDFDIRHKVAMSLELEAARPGRRARPRPSWAAGSSAACSSRRAAAPTPCSAAAASCPSATPRARSSATAAATTTRTAPTSTVPNVPVLRRLQGGSNDDFLNGIFKASDFPAPALGQRGTLGRNTFHGPRYFNVDLALIKGFQISRADLQLRLESFNVFNTVNLQQPGQRPAEPGLRAIDVERWPGPDHPGLGPRAVLEDTVPVAPARPGATARRSGAFVFAPSVREART